MILDPAVDHLSAPVNARAGSGHPGQCGLRLPCFAAHYPARLLVTITIEVLLMPCWRMPQLTKRLARWIHPRRHMA